MNCPACGARQIGALTVTQYYCWECCVEFTVIGDRVEVYQVALDGSLVAAGTTAHTSGVAEPAVSPMASRL